MNAHIDCRIATLQDAEIVTEFSSLCALESENLELDADRVRAGVEAALRDPAVGRYYLAEIRRKAAGQIMVTREWSDWRNAWIWWIQSVYVSRDTRRLGVFSALLEHVREQAIQEGAALLRLYVDEDNNPAESTYLARGFTRAHYRMLERTLATGES